jgi:type I restriction-modification system DNA methylase subunit
VYIKKHIKYIDYRLNELAGYINGNQINIAHFQNNHINFIDAIIDCLIGNRTPSKKIFNAAFDAVDDLLKVVVNWDLAEDGDIIGYIYQRLCGYNHKKRYGQYFTPQDIVDYLIERSIPEDIDLRSFRVLDPSCGSGQFLLAAYKRILSLYRKNRAVHNNTIERIIHDHLFGIDIDATAIKITRYNLERLSGTQGNWCRNLDTANYLLSDFYTWDSPPDSEYYDLIIGNPPWGSKIPTKDRKTIIDRYTACSSGINTFTLFIEKSIEHLKNNAMLAFLMPEALLNIKAHSSARKFILDTTCIKDIALWGDRFKGVYAPAISLIASKENNSGNRSNNILSIASHKGSKSDTSTLIPQEYYANTPDYIFSVHYTRKAVNVISRIEDQACLYLKDRARFFLGIVTGNNDKYVYRERNESHPDPILIGKDISPYKINFSGHYFKYDHNELQQVAPRDVYTNTDKLYYKFIGRKLTFAIDTQGYYSLNNVNGFILLDKQLNTECIAAIMNSSLMQFYYDKMFFTIKVLRGNLERLPLLKLDNSTEKKIRSLVACILHSDSENTIHRYQEQIDDIVFSKYRIPDRDAYAISSY